MSSIAIIPARSGSKGLKDKNIKELLGKPLIGYAIEAAKDSGMFDEIHLSTDSQRYADIGTMFGANVPFLRSVETAGDKASSWEVVRETLNRYSELGRNFERIMLLQPTSPLRTADDICATFDIMRETQAMTVVSVCEMDHSPLLSNTLPKNRCMNGFIQPQNMKRRQELPLYYRVNGAIYLLDVPYFLKNGLSYDAQCFAYIMPTERSLDIDTELDVWITECTLINNAPPPTHWKKVSASKENVTPPPQTLYHNGRRCA